jgi:DNA-binding winged helix-turn-helix (wHTH) protein
LNSREIISEYKKLKLTEKEVDIIIHLSKNKEPVSVNELQKKVWS